MLKCFRLESTCFGLAWLAVLDNFLASKGLAQASQVLLYLAVSKLGEKPIDGITEVNPEGLTSSTGKWAHVFKVR